MKKAIIFKPLLNLVFLFFSLCLISSTVLAAAPLVDPTVVGPYRIGHIKIPASTVGPLAGYSTNVSIWYPTTTTTGTTADYTTTHYSGFPYTLPSPLGAIEGNPNSPSVVPGQFPLFIVAHGSGSINRDSGRMTEMPMNEFLASHGFIVVGYTYGDTTKQTVLETEALINYMINSSSIRSSINPNKVGLLGFSLGGRVFAVAAGNPDIQRDPRIKAIIGYEALYAPNNDYYGNIKDIKAATLALHEGYLPVGAFNGAAGPVIDIFTKRFTHSSYGTAACSTVKVNRDLGIANGVAEPLIDPQGNLYAQRAWDLWHSGDPSINQAAGGASDFCNVLTWTPAISPSLLTGNKITPEDETIRRLRLYTLSFLKVYLEGDANYAQFLTEEYAKKNFASDDLTVEVRK